MSLRFLLFIVLLFLCPCGALYAATYEVNGDIVGKVGHYTIKKEDNLKIIARNFDIGIVELLAANPGVTPRTLKTGADLTIPTAYILPYVRNGIVLNLSKLRLFYFPDRRSVMTFPVGIGREGWETPTGSTVVTLKRKDPVWIPPDSIREEEPNLPDIVPAGPHNPLGAYAINIGLPGERIHGTDSPYSVGKRSSHGCIRLYPEDIKALFGIVVEGTSVVIIDTPYALGWRGNTLFLEVRPTPAQADAIAKYQTPIPEELPEIYDAIRNTASHASIDWQVVNTVIMKHTGIPSAIGKRF